MSIHLSSNVYHLSEYEASWAQRSYFSAHVLHRLFLSRQREGPQLWTPCPFSRALRCQELEADRADMSTSYGPRTFVNEREGGVLEGSGIGWT